MSYSDSLEIEEYRRGAKGIRLWDKKNVGRRRYASRQRVLCSATPRK